MTFEFVNFGGDIGIPYLPNKDPISFEIVVEGVYESYAPIITANGLSKFKFFLMLPSHHRPRWLLISHVRHLKQLISIML